MIHKCVVRSVYSLLTLVLITCMGSDSTDYFGGSVYASYSRESSKNKQGRSSSPTRIKSKPRVSRNTSKTSSKPKAPTYQSKQNWQFNPVSEGSMRVHVFVNKAVDSTVLELSDGRLVRLMGIKVPESVAKQAGLLLEELCVEKEISLEYAKPRKDSDGTKLVYVYSADNQLLNAELLKQGYARVREGLDFSRMEEFQAYESEARAAGLGLWNEQMPEQFIGEEGDIYESM